ncbi:MAG TPA: 8-oxo-dGTP diphosphatase [Anaerolinea sp.]|nr:8-oxo-dGTP diphosphatase [Anaerolinea sp.]
MPDVHLRYTLCFLTRGDSILMLLRRRPPNQGLWNGIGGRIEPGEDAVTGMLREIREETAYEVGQVHFAGLLTWEGFEIPEGGLYIFTAEAPEGEAVGNDEGILAWKKRDWVFHSDEVVSNIHQFGPLALNGHAPANYHFVYLDGEIVEFSVRELPDAERIPASDWNG